MSDNNTSSESNEQVVPQLLPIEKNNEVRKNTILTNIVKMLTERNLLDQNRQQEHINKILAIQSDDQLYRIDLDFPQIYGKNNGTMIIKIINQRITSISKSSGINDFLITYKMLPKIIVVNSINPKARYQVQSDPVSYPNTEFFLEKELLINIIDHVSQPKFILLDDAETKEVLEKYHSKRRDMQKMLFTDPIACYYNAKPGQMFRVIRPSETSGQAVAYRLVIKGQIKDS